MDVTQAEHTIEGIRTVVRSCGPASDREATVLVHGNPGSGADWDDLLPRVGSLGRAIAPDLPGYGRSDRPRDFEYTTAGYGRHLGAVLDHLGVERAHLVLHDFGGPWGMAWAAAHPDAVASLTLINIGALPGYRWHKYARIWRTRILGELFVATITRWVWRLLMRFENPKPFPRAVSDRMYDDLDRGTKRAILRLYRATPDLGALTCELATRIAARPAPVPVAVVWGAADKALPVAYAARQPDYFPAAEVHVLDGCGHWPFVDDPDRVAAAVIPFLQRARR